MVKTFSLNTNIPQNRELRITLPADVPTGPAEVVLVVSSLARPNGFTLRDLANSEFIGMWQDRPDI